MATQPRPPFFNRRLFRFLMAAAMIGVVACTSSRPRTSSDGPLLSDRAAREARIETLLRRMTIEEKIEILSGTGFETKPIARLGIPSIRMVDGSVGVRHGKQTAFPAGIAMGATFNPALIQEIGVAMADEARLIGRNMLLGPCVNLSRHPFGGRNFESFGEDPNLSSQMAAHYVVGVQSRNVLASVKHFAMNDQEVERMSIDVRASPEAMFELHFQPFRAAVDAKAWSVMSAYNKVNGAHATENSFLINDVLKSRWGFQGFVVSDWDATHSTVEAANAGLDLEMPFGKYFGEPLLKAVRAGQVREDVIDDKVRRILRAMDAIGLLPNSPKRSIEPPKGPESPEHQELALEAARQSIVLLKNDGGFLPFKRDRIRSLLVIGPGAIFPRTGGGGSSRVESYRFVTPLDGLRREFGERTRLTHIHGFSLKGDFETIPAEFLVPEAGSDKRGLKGEYFSNQDLKGHPLFTRVDETIDFNFELAGDARTKENFSVRWTGLLRAPAAGEYLVAIAHDDGARLFIRDQEVVSEWKPSGRTVHSTRVLFKEGELVPIRFEYFQGAMGAVATLGWLKIESGDPVRNAAQAAAKADAVVIFAGLSSEIEGEARDLSTMDLPSDQEAIIRAATKANKNTVVVLNSGNPMGMERWLNGPRVLLQAWYPGQEGGRAIAEILLGKTNPSGKLPVSFPKRWPEAAAFGNYPGKNGVVEYREGQLLGYRHFDKKRIRPQFPFGFGLSYSRFSFRDLKVEWVPWNDGTRRAKISFVLRNEGKVAGAEVAQIYLGETNPSKKRPLRELISFHKQWLAPGEEVIIEAIQGPSIFSVFDSTSMSWVPKPGLYRIEVGSSSRDLPLKAEIRFGGSTP